MNGRIDGRIYGIQLVRAIACLSIVIAHSFAYAEFNFETIGSGALDFWGRYGLLNFTAVFFTISGFFLSASIYRIDEESAEGTLSFLKKKFIRIYPVYWLAIICAIMLRVIVQGGYTSAGAVIKSFWLLPFPNTPYVLNIEWTLLIEVLFFLVASLFASAKRKKWFPFAMGLWGAIIWIAVLTGKSDFSVQLAMPRILISGQALFFILGVFLYYIYIHVRRTPISKTLGVCLICAALALFVLNYETLILRKSNILYGILLQQIILSGICLIAALTPISGKNLLVHTGDYSYAIYLIHATILDLVFWLMNRWGYSIYWWMFVIAICAALLVGIALGHWEHTAVEWLKQRVLNKKDNRYILPNKRYAYFFVAAVLVFLCLLGLKVVRDIQSMPSYETIAFDEAQISDSQVVPGWVDRLIVSEDPEEGSVYAEGWAYDPLSNTQIEQIAVLSNGESVPVSIVWHDRPGVREAIGEQVPITCGYELKAKDVPDTDDITFYAVLSDGTFLNIPYSESVVSGSN